MNVYWAESVRGCGIVPIDTIMGSSSPQCRPQRHLATRASLALLVADASGSDGGGVGDSCDRGGGSSAVDCRFSTFPFQARSSLSMRPINVYERSGSRLDEKLN
ncbi:hypothetical protein Trydic_g21172 [Trypoxylus dichotomus]